MLADFRAKLGLRVASTSTTEATLEGPIVAVGAGCGAAFWA
jgi:hypothetical protein